MSSACNYEHIKNAGLRKDSHTYMDRDNHFAVTEKGYFTRNTEPNSPHGVRLTEDIFDLLVEFITENIRINTEGEKCDFFTFSEIEGVGKVLRPGNFSGVVSLSNGTQIEIFNGIRSRAVLLELLTSIENIPVRMLSQTELKRGGMNIFEMFVRMFINEVFFIMKSGFKQTYVPVQGNERFVKGKTVYSIHATKNFAHKERFFVEYDDFSINRTENKLLKSTALFLSKLTQNNQNKKQLKIILTALDEVDCSSDYSRDFKMSATDRSMNVYHAALSWCRIFLLNKSSFFFSSKKSSYAALFPMNRLFESYAAKKLQDSLLPPAFSFRLLNNHVHDLDRMSVFAHVLPDIIFDKWHSGSFTIIDIIWSAKDFETAASFNEFDSKICAMYSNMEKFSASALILLYPKSDSFNENFETLHFTTNDGAPVTVYFVNLRELNSEIKQIAASLHD